MIVFVTRAFRGIPAAFLACAILSGCAGGKGPQLSVPPDAGLEERLSQTSLIVERLPEEPYWQFHLGEIYLDADSLAQAESAFLAAIDRDPKYAPALSQLTRLYHSQHRYEEGKALLLDPRDGSARPGKLDVALALHLEALGDVYGAEDITRRIEPSDDAWETSGAAFTYVTLRGDFCADAPAKARKALRRNPHSAANHNNHGIALLQEGDPEAAREAFGEALRLDPGLPGPYYNMAILEKFYMLDDEAARQWFARYSALAADDPDGLEGILDGNGPGGADTANPSEHPATQRDGGR